MAIKLSYSHIKQYIEEFGYKLVSKEYRNANTKMEKVCPKGHFFEIRYNDFQQGHRCSVCYGNKKYSYNQIKEYIESFDYLLVSKEYKNVGTKLNLVCPKKHFFDMSYSCFRQGQRCPECAGVKKYSYNQIKEYIERFGYKLVSKEYKNNNVKMELVCPEGHGFEIVYSSFRRGHRCPICVGNKKLSYGHIKQYIENFGYSLVSKEYKNTHTKMEMVCTKGHKFEMSYSGFQTGYRCPICIKSRGEKEVLNFVQSIYGGRIVENDRTQIINPKTGYNLELDIFLPELNKAIEYNGEYWHSKDNIKNKDNQKLVQCKSKGIELLVIEDEKWKKTKDYNIIKYFIEKE